MKDWRDVLEYIYRGLDAPWEIEPELAALLLAAELAR